MSNVGKKVLIWGTGEVASSFKKQMEDIVSDQVVGFVVDAAYKNSDEFLGLPVTAFEELESRYSPDDVEILTAIYLNKMNDFRKSVFLKCKQKGYHLYTFRHPSAVIHSDTIGEGNIFAPNVFIHPNTVIGDGNFFDHSCNIAHNTTVGNFNFIGVHGTVLGGARIADNCVVSANAVVGNFVCAADYTLVGACAFLNRSSSPYDVYVPEKTIKIDKKSTEINLVRSDK